MLSFPPWSRMWPFPLTLQAAPELFWEIQIKAAILVEAISSLAKPYVLIQRAQVSAFKKQQNQLPLWGLNFGELQTILFTIIFPCELYLKSKTTGIPLKLPKICPFANWCWRSFSRWQALAEFSGDSCFGLWTPHETWKPLYFPTLCCFFLLPSIGDIPLYPNKQANLPVTR